MWTLHWWAIAVMFLALAGGLTLIVLGFRGKTVGDHPSCAKCGLDLIDTPEDVVICPKCKADLSEDGAVEAGVRKKSPGLWAGGLALLVVVVGGIGLHDAMHVWTSPQFDKFRSTSALLKDIQQTDDKNRVTNALNELTYRLSSDTKISAEQKKELIEQTLKTQAGDAKAWSSDWGSVIETAHTKKLLTGDQWKTYWRQSAKYRVVSAIVGQMSGHPIELLVKMEDVRVGNMSGKRWKQTMTVKSVRIEGQERALAGVVERTEIEPKEQRAMPLTFGPGELRDYSLPVGNGKRVSLTLLISVVDDKRQIVEGADWEVVAEGTIDVEAGEAKVPGPQ